MCDFQSLYGRYKIMNSQKNSRQMCMELQQRRRAGGKVDHNKSTYSNPRHLPFEKHRDILECLFQSPHPDFSYRLTSRAFGVVSLGTVRRCHILVCNTYLIFHRTIFITVWYDSLRTHLLFVCTGQRSNTRSDG